MDMITQNKKMSKRNCLQKSKREFENKCFKLYIAYWPLYQVTGGAWLIFLPWLFDNFFISASVQI